MQTRHLRTPRRLRLTTLTIICALILSGCGLVRVEASGSESHIDWSVGVPF